jgi:hypothetical protein
VLADGELDLDDDDDTDAGSASGHKEDEGEFSARNMRRYKRKNQGKHRWMEQTVAAAATLLDGSNSRSVAHCLGLCPLWLGHLPRSGAPLPVRPTRIVRRRRSGPKLAPTARSRSGGRATRSPRRRLWPRPSSSMSRIVSSASRLHSLVRMFVK